MLGFVIQAKRVHNGDAGDSIRLGNVSSTVQVGFIEGNTDE